MARTEVGESIGRGAELGSAQETQAGDPTEQRGRGSEPRSLARGGTLGRYVVLGMLGRGGMGTVYKAYDDTLDRAVAIKLLHAETTERHAQRLRREAQALAKLSHPNVVHVYEVGQSEGQWFIVMELVPGQTLRQWQTTNERDWRECIRVYLQAGEGLAAAHAAGLVHRDFKPDNCIIDEQGRPKVLDFGLVREAGGVEEPSLPDAEHADEPSNPRGSLTRTGAVLGTLAYMPLEQLDGRPVDARSDQFSFCVSLYEALYGERPLAGESVGALAAALTSGDIRKAPRGTAVPSAVRRVLVQGLSSDPEARWPSMEALLAELRQLVEPPRRRGMTLALGGLVALVGVGAGLWVGRRSEPRQVCGGAAVEVAEIWSAEHEQAIEAALLGTGVSYAPETWARLESRLDDYFAKWAQTRTAICEATRVHEEQPESLMDQRIRCMDDKLRTAAALTRALTDADAQTVEYAVKALEGLPGFEHCRRLEDEGDPAVEDAATRERIDALREELAEVAVMFALNRIEDAHRRSTEALAEARALGYAPVLVEAMFQTANVHTHRGEYDQALSLAQEGLLLTRAHGLELAETDMLSLLVFLNTDFTEELELASWQIELLETLADRTMSDPADRARILAEHANLERRYGRRDEAIELLERSLELYVRAEEHGYNQLVTRDRLAAAYLDAERFDDAARLLAETKELTTRVLGAGHPFRAHVLLHSARVEHTRSNHAAAADMLKEALALYEESVGSDHPNVSALLNGLAIQQGWMGETEQAVATLRRALAVAREAYGPEHIENTVIETNLGNMLRRLGQAEEALAHHDAVRDAQQRLEVGVRSRYQLLDNRADDLRQLDRCDEAEAEYRAANALRATEGEPEETGAAYAWLGIGLCQRRRGEHAQARRSFESGLALTEDDDNVALLRFALAMELHESEPDRASTLAKQAREFWAKRPYVYRLYLAEVDAWLAGGPGVMPPY